ncbi:hypothetical protein G6F31_018598 [Rhizopus arrhizus]|nr:hypothetical protein G6F31_018598 [Rhizopus arrhizus]
MGILDKRRGSIRLNGQETVGMAPHRIPRLGVVYCPEERAVFRSLNVTENLMLPPRLAAGGIAQADLSNQELLVAQTRSTLPPLDKQLAQVTHQLAVYLGQPPAALRVAPLRLADLTLPASIPTGVPSALTRQRPDILAAEALSR